MKRGPQAITALMVLGFVAIVAVVIWRSSQAEPEESSLNQPQDRVPAAASAGEVPPAEPSSDEARDPSPEAAARHASPSSIEAENAPGVEPFDPAVRDHAKQMLIPNAQIAMERGDVKNLYEMLEIVHQHRGEKLLTDADIGAVEAAIACLEHEPDAREEAADLLRFGPPTTFALSLQKACSTR